MNEPKDRRSSPWALYNALIDPIPSGRTADEVILGSHWAYVRSGDRVGLAMNLARVHDTETRPRLLSGSCRDLSGIPLRELAAAATSWNFAEASLGVAAINAFWNAVEHETVARAMEREDRKAFEVWREKVRGKKVAVIGHFMRLEQILGGDCELSILEKRPGHGDYPDSACEFILPEQDIIFSTGVTLINKTLPRLLELSRRQGMILVGPTVSLAPPLFGFGVRDLQGFVITDPDLCREVVRGRNENVSIFDAGKRVGIAGEG
jgi:uncharacterized protein (DUF4213/DUF364 family)